MIFLQAYISDCLHKTKLHHSRTHTHRNDINLLARSLSLSLGHSLTERHTYVCTTAAVQRCRFAPRSHGPAAFFSFLRSTQVGYKGTSPHLQSVIATAAETMKRTEEGDSTAHISIYTRARMFDTVPAIRSFLETDSDPELPTQRETKCASPSDTMLQRATYKMVPLGEPLERWNNSCVAHTVNHKLSVTNSQARVSAAIDECNQYRRGDETVQECCLCSLLVGCKTFWPQSLRVVDLAQ